MGRTQRRILTLTLGLTIAASACTTSGPPAASTAALPTPEATDTSISIPETTPSTATPSRTGSPGQASSGATSSTPQPTTGASGTTFPTPPSAGSVTRTASTSTGRTVSSAAPTPTGGGTSPSNRPPAVSTSPPPPAPTPTSSATGLPSGLRGLDIERIPTDRKIVALTFDAGANADALPSILKTLHATGTPATFFLTGRWSANYPGMVAQIKAGGYRIGNHSDSHPMMTKMTAAAISAEMATARTKIMAAGGTDPRPFFRFPYGDRDARTIAAVNAAGYVPVRWTVDTLGWKGTSGGITRQKVLDRVLAAAQPGEIVLMHLGSNPDDHSTLDADALPFIISGLTSRGYRFVTLDALLG